MIRNRYRLTLLFALAWLSNTPAFAVTIGQVQMQSGLGQPLSARIPVYDAEDADVQSLTVQLASEDAFRRLGIDRSLYSDVQISIQIDDTGRPFILLSSVRPFSEPVLNVLLDASWRDGGRQVKELTALVDPPFISKAAVQTIEAPTVPLNPVVAAPVIEPVKRTPEVPTGSTAKSMPDAPKPVPATPTKSIVPPTPKPAPVRNAATESLPVPRIPATQDNQREVLKGESLYTIAIAHRQSQAPGVSLNQMMTAIQRANPEAFIRGDASRLKRGSVLRLPDQQQVRALLPDDSAGLLAGQWTRKVQAQPAPVLGAANRLSRPSAASSDRSSANVNPVNQGRLKIVPTVGDMNNAGSQSGASKSGQGSELRAENTQSQEEIAARQAEIANLRNQLDDAAKLQSESKRLIELQNSQIKQLTARMQQLENGGRPGEKPTGAEAVAVQATAADPWYYSPYAAFGALLLIAGLLGVLLKRRG